MSMRIHLRVYGQYKAIQEINIIPIISYLIKKFFYLMITIWKLISEAQQIRR